jgi:hypothetical protein
MLNDMLCQVMGRSYSTHNLDHNPTCGSGTTARLIVQFEAAVHGLQYSL